MMPLSVTDATGTSYVKYIEYVLGTESWQSL